MIYFFILDVSYLHVASKGWLHGEVAIPLLKMYGQEIFSCPLYLIWVISSKTILLLIEKM